MEKITRSNGIEYSMKNDKDRFFFPDEWMKFEDKLKAKQKHSCKMLINTGARIMEVQNVKVEDIIFDKYRSRINLTKTKTKAKKGEKKGRPRSIPISTQFARYLRKYINDKKLKDLDYIGVLSTPAMNTGMKKAARLSGLKNPEDFSPHNIRKTLEVWLMALGVDTLPLVAHFGHDVKTAAQHYVSPDIFSWEHKKKMREVIGDLYAK